jgi:hypothetical protein
MSPMRPVAVVLKNPPDKLTEIWLWSLSRDKCSFG